MTKQDFIKAYNVINTIGNDIDKDASMGQEPYPYAYIFRTNQGELLVSYQEEHLLEQVAYITFPQILNEYGYDWDEIIKVILTQLVQNNLVTL